MESHPDFASARPGADPQATEALPRTVEGVGGEGSARATMPSFLSPIIGDEAGQFVIRNGRTGAVIAARILPAFESEARRKGLLGHERLDAGVAMIIAPTNAVHTFFMRFPIDIAFVAKNGRVLKIRRHVHPWCMSASWGGYAVIEMAAGSFGSTITVGDEVVLERTNATSSHNASSAHE